MDRMLGVDWRRLVVPATLLLATVPRGSLVYRARFGLLSLGLKREAGGLGVADLLVVVLLADAAQNALVDDDTSIPEGLLLVGTLVFWCHALN